MPAEGCSPMLRLWSFALCGLAALSSAFCPKMSHAQVYKLVPVTEGGYRLEESSTLLSENDFEPMTFKIVMPVPGFSQCPVFYANGRITEGTTDRFKLLLQRDHVTCGEVTLNSPGGDLDEGLDLGKLIRSYGLNTSVAKESDLSRFVPGECDSSCNFAYMGGVRRDAMGPEYGMEIQGTMSHFGVHRFQPTDEPTNSPDTNDPNSLAPMEKAQKASAELVDFLQEMGVDPGFLRFMAGVRKVTFLPQSLLRQLRVIQVETTEWEVKVVDGAYTLEGHVGVGPSHAQDTVELICKSGTLGIKRLVAKVTLSKGYYYSDTLPKIVTLRGSTNNRSDNPTSEVRPVTIEPFRADGGGQLTTDFVVTKEAADIFTNASNEWIEINFGTDSKEAERREWWETGFLLAAHAFFDLRGSQVKIQQFISACQ
jgi:hypothetical protein